MKNGKPADFPWILPYMMVKNGQAAQQFYEQALGFVTKDAVKNETGDVIHLEMLYQGQIIMFGQEGAYECSTTKSPKSSKSESPVTMILYHADVDSAYQQAIKAGAKSVSEPEDMFWGDRVCRVEDLDGYCWSIATAVKEHS